MSSPRYERYFKRLALCPFRQFIEIIDISVAQSAEGKKELHFDVEWLAIMTKTHHLLSTSRGNVTLPAIASPVTSAEEDGIRSLLSAEYGSSLTIPEPSLPSFRESLSGEGNAQTDRLLRCLGLPHIWTRPVTKPPPPPPFPKGGSKYEPQVTYSIDRGDSIQEASIDQGGVKDENEIDLDDMEAS